MEKDDVKSLHNRLDEMAARMATKDDLNNFAAKYDIANMATKDHLKNFVTKDDIANMATKDDLKNFVAKDDLADVVSMISDVRNDMVSINEDTRRYMGILNEETNHKIDLVLEGFKLFNEHMGRYEASNDGEHAKLDRQDMFVKSDVAGLTKRVEKLEKKSA
jgi:hypothetical protein